MRATSVVTVLLPLVPVIPTTGPGAAACKQFDVADHRHAQAPRGGKEGIGLRQSRRGHDDIGIRQQRFVQSAE